MTKEPPRVVLLCGITMTTTMTRAELALMGEGEKRECDDIELKAAKKNVFDVFNEFFYSVRHDITSLMLKPADCPSGFEGEAAKMEKKAEKFYGANSSWLVY
jgi:hypothetical protein